MCLVIDKLYPCDDVTLYVLMNDVELELLFCSNHLEVYIDKNLFI